VPQTAAVLGCGPKTLYRLFNESDDGRTARVPVGDREVVVRGYRLGRQLWVVTESLLPIFDGAGEVRSSSDP
jgi:hypothetical protein